MLSGKNKQNKQKKKKPTTITTKMTEITDFLEFFLCLLCLGFAMQMGFAMHGTFVSCMKRCICFF